MPITQECQNKPHSTPLRNMLRGFSVYQLMSGVNGDLSGGCCVSAYNRPKWQHQQCYGTRLWARCGDMLSVIGHSGGAVCAPMVGQPNGEFFIHLIILL